MFLLFACYVYKKGHIIIYLNPLSYISFIVVKLYLAIQYNIYWTLIRSVYPDMPNNISRHIKLANQFQKILLLEKKVQPPGERVEIRTRWGGLGSLGRLSSHASIQSTQTFIFQGTGAGEGNGSIWSGLTQ